MPPKIKITKEEIVDTALNQGSGGAGTQCKKYSSETEVFNAAGFF